MDHCRHRSAQHWFELSGCDTGTGKHRAKHLCRVLESPHHCAADELRAIVLPRPPTKVPPPEEGRLRAQDSRLSSCARSALCCFSKGGVPASCAWCGRRAECHRHGRAGEGRSLGIRQQAYEAKVCAMRQDLRQQEL